MNKKGQLVILPALIILLIICSIIIYLALKEKDIQCQKLNFEEYKLINGLDYCEDYDKNLHSIYYECNDLLGLSDCNARLITIYNYDNSHS